VPSALNAQPVSLELRVLARVETNHSAKVLARTRVKANSQAKAARAAMKTAMAVKMHALASRARVKVKVSHKAIAKGPMPTDKVRITAPPGELAAKAIAKALVKIKAEQKSLPSQKNSCLKPHVTKPCPR